MKKSKSTVMVTVLILILTARVQAETITIFDSNATISDGNTYDTVVIKGNGTVVDMTGGDANLVIVMNSSTFNMTGGNIGFETNKGISSFDSSVLNLSGGRLRKVNTYGESEINIFGDPNIDICEFYDSTVATISSNEAFIDTCHPQGNSTLSLSAGSLLLLSAIQNSTVTISGGEVLWSVSVCHNAKLNISDITTNILYVNSGGTVNLSGGDVNSIGRDIGGDSSSLCQINVIGYSLSAVPYGGSHGYGEISGYWNNDVPFSISLGYESSYPVDIYARIALYDGVIPTNCLNKPESDLSGDCKVNFTDFSKMAAEWLQDGTE